jgi:4-oxalocrotonate tautomerase
MPIISISVTGQPDAALSAQIAAEITELTRVHLKKDPKLTAVAITYVEPQHWFAGGRSLADQGQNTFWLDIKVVDGTNTKAELSDYVGQVFVVMTRLVGRVHHESYVLVHEVPAAAYGFGGRTQEYRYISGRLQAAA